MSTPHRRTRPRGRPEDGAPMPCPDVAERSPPMRPGTMQLTVTPVRRELRRQRLGETDETGLGGGDMERVRARRDACSNAAEIDDAAVLVLDHVRQHRARAEKRAIEHDADDVAPLLAASFRANGASSRMAALFTRMSMRPKLRDRVLDHGGDRGLVGDVGEMHQRASRRPPRPPGPPFRPPRAKTAH